MKSLISELKTRSGTSYIVSGKGPDLVFVHGQFSSKYSFSQAIPHLSSNYRVWAYDIHGYGSSTSFEKYGLLQQTEQLTDFMSETGISHCILVGHSMGGGIAQAYAALNSERVTHLVLLDSTDLRAYPRFWNSYFDSEVNSKLTGRDLLFWVFRNAWISKFIGAIHTRYFLRKVLGNLYYDSRSLSNSTIDHYMALISSSRFWVNLPKLIAINREEKREIERIIMSARDATYRVSILWGRQDTWFLAKQALELARFYGVGEVHFIENTGHLPHEEAPESFVNALREVLDYCR